MNTVKYLSVQNVSINLDMHQMDKLPSYEEIEKVLKLSRAYTKLNVPEQQRINMFDYIIKHWYE